MKFTIEDSIPEDIAIELRDIEIVHRETGTYSMPPSDTIRRAQGVLDEIGVTSIAKIDTRYTDGVPIFKVNDAPIKARCHREACYRGFPPTPLSDPPRECFGKGITEEQSKASAMMESVERYCGQRFPHHQVIHASYEEVKGYALNPCDFNFPERAIKCKECGERDWDCHQELRKVCTEWTWGYSLIHRKPLLVPAALIYYPYISDDNTSFIYNDTGGLAAGNTLEEAILQGISEVIERDALYSAFNLGDSRGGHSLHFKATQNGHLLKFINEVVPHEKLFVFDIGSGGYKLNVSIFAAFICYEIGNARYYFGGSGAGLDPEVALLRALTELEQQKVRQQLLVEFDQGNLMAHNKGESKNTGLLGYKPNRSTGNIKLDIEYCLDRLSENNMDTIVVDLTHPEIKIPVVRVVIPKLISYSGEPIEESRMLSSVSRG